MTYRRPGEDVNPKQAIYAPYVIQDREKIGRRIVDVEAVQGIVSADVIEAVYCMATGVRVSGLPTKRTDAHQASRRCLLTVRGEVGRAERDPQVRKARGIRAVRRCSSECENGRCDSRTLSKLGTHSRRGTQAGSSSCSNSCSAADDTRGEVSSEHVATFGPARPPKT